MELGHSQQADCDSPGQIFKLQWDCAVCVAQRDCKNNEGTSCSPCSLHLGGTLISALCFACFLLIPGVWMEFQEPSLSGLCRAAIAACQEEVYKLNSEGEKTFFQQGCYGPFTCLTKARQFKVQGLLTAAGACSHILLRFVSYLCRQKEGEMSCGTNSHSLWFSWLMLEYCS